jgi:tRNA threonylcarbamoyladenosine biosynthesis protein TsaB
MTVVGFDTSMPATTACVIASGGEPVSSPVPDAARLAAPPEHSAELLPMLAELLERAGTGWEEVRAVAVGVGPGTFTGLRIGVATARGLAQGLGVPLHPVSSLEALAAGLAVDAAPGRPLLPLIDAKRAQVFASLYRAGEPLELGWGPLALDREGLLARVRAVTQPPLAAGDWTLESRSYLEAAGIEVPAPDSGLHAVSAVQICRIGMAGEPVAPEQVNPVYVRVPDAEITRRARIDDPDPTSGR